MSCQWSNSPPNSAPGAAAPLALLQLCYWLVVLLIHCVTLRNLLLLSVSLFPLIHFSAFGAMSLLVCLYNAYWCGVMLSADPCSRDEITTATKTTILQNYPFPFLLARLIFLRTNQEKYRLGVLGTGRVNWYFSPDLIWIQRLENLPVPRVRGHPKQLQ